MDDNKKVLERLDLIISFLLEINDTLHQEERVVWKKRIGRLKKIGFDNGEIARILGVDKTKISKQLYETKRKKNQRSKK